MQQNQEFISIVDKWSLYDNCDSMHPIVEGNKIIDPQKLIKIKELCQRRNQ